MEWSWHLRHERDCLAWVAAEPVSGLMVWQDIEQQEALGMGTRLAECGVGSDMQRGLGWAGG